MKIANLYTATHEKKEYDILWGKNYNVTKKTPMKLLGDDVMTLLGDDIIL